MRPVVAALVALIAVGCDAPRRPPSPPSPALVWHAAGASTPGPVVDAGPPPREALDALGRFTPAFALAEARAVFEALDAARFVGRAVGFEAPPGAPGVNAWARCERDGTASLRVTPGLLRLAAALAWVESVDGATGSALTPAWSELAVRQLRAHAPPAEPDVANLPRGAALDAARLAAQRQRYGDVLRFAFAHELAHIARGDGACAQGDAGPRTTPRARELDADDWALDPARPWSAEARRGARTLLRFLARWEAAADASGNAIARSHPEARARLARVGAGGL